MFAGPSLPLARDPARPLDRHRSGRRLSACLEFFGPAILVPLNPELPACPQVLTASLPGRQKLHRGSGPPSTVDRRLPAS
jgi:hypothetical protein